MIRLSASVGFWIVLAAAVLVGPRHLAAAASEPAVAGGSVGSGITANDANLQGDRAVMSRDYTTALRWYRISADQGNARAQVELGYFFQHGVGVAENYGEALRWYRLAAVQGNPLAENQLGYFYEHGLGVGRDCGLARHWFKRAADQAWPAARYNIDFIDTSSHCSIKGLMEARGWMIDANAAQVPLPLTQHDLAGPLPAHR